MVEPARQKVEAAALNPRNAPAGVRRMSLLSRKPIRDPRLISRTKVRRFLVCQQKARQSGPL
jgi:hypothetical protein